MEVYRCWLSWNLLSLSLRRVLTSVIHRKKLPQCYLIIHRKQSVLTRFPFELFLILNHLFNSQQIVWKAALCLAPLFLFWFDHDKSGTHPTASAGGQRSPAAAEDQSTAEHNQQQQRRRRRRLWGEWSVCCWWSRESLVIRNGLMVENEQFLQWRFDIGV